MVTKIGEIRAHQKRMKPNPLSDWKMGERNRPQPLAGGAHAHSDLALVKPNLKSGSGIPD